LVRRAQRHGGEDAIEFTGWVLDNFSEPDFDGYEATIDYLWWLWLS